MIAPGREAQLDGIFLEPLGHNPLINWYRRRTPQMRTEDEHPLLKSDLALAREYFSKIRSRFFHFAVLGAVPLRRSLLFKPALAIGEGIDRVLLSCFKYDPINRRYGPYVMGFMRIGAGMVFVALATLLTVLWRKELVMRRRRVA
jgi:hypothetical protein